MVNSSSTPVRMGLGVRHAKNPDERLGMGKVAGRRGRAVPCGVSTDCTSPLTDEHLGRFQTLVTVLGTTIIAQLLLNFVEYVSRIGV